MEDPQILPPPTNTHLEPISRPSSTSTQASQTQLPGISSIAAAAAAAVSVTSATSSPQMRTMSAPNAPPAPMYSTSPGATVQNVGGNLPTCQNCSTSTTPLWRRDEAGSVLCNACGLFLKLHGRPRPISLKTDVIKSRNRVKTMRPDMAMKKKNQAVAPDANGAELHAQNAAAAALGVRRTSQKAGNGHLDDSNSPISRTATPNMYTGHLSMYHGVDDHHLQQVSAFATAPSPGRAPSPMNGERLDVPQTPEQLLALNASLRTRVDELEVINDLIQRRLQHFEAYGTGANVVTGANEEAAQAEAQLRAHLDAVSQSESQLRGQLDESHRRENNLKRRLEVVEDELKEAKESLEVHENGRAKRPRLDADETAEEPKPEPEPTMA